MTIIAIILALLTTPAEADELRSTAPQYLTSASAWEHLRDARIAAAVYHVDPALVLSIAWHESRYTDARTPESGGRVSCGAMTPEPTARCTGSLLDGYLAGAKHLRGWLDATRTERDGIDGYAGGYALLALCRSRPTSRACGTPEVFLRRAAWIRAAINHNKRTS